MHGYFVVVATEEHEGIELRQMDHVAVDREYLMCYLECRSGVVRTCPGVSSTHRFPLKYSNVVALYSVLEPTVTCASGSSSY